MAKRKQSSPPGQQDLLAYGQHVQAILNTTEMDYREFFKKLSQEEFGEFGFTGLSCPKQ